MGCPRLRIVWNGEKFDPFPLDMCSGKKFSGVDGGPSGGSSVCRPGSEDPHRYQRKFVVGFTIQDSHISGIFYKLNFINWTEVRTNILFSLVLYVNTNQYTHLEICKEMQASLRMNRFGGFTLWWDWHWELGQKKSTLCWCSWETDVFLYVITRVINASLLPRTR